MELPGGLQRVPGLQLCELLSVLRWVSSDAAPLSRPAPIRSPSLKLLQVALVSPVVHQVKLWPESYFASSWVSYLGWMNYFPPSHLSGNTVIQQEDTQAIF